MRSVISGSCISELQNLIYEKRVDEDECCLNCRPVAGWLPSDTNDQTWGNGGGGGRGQGGASRQQRHGQCSFPPCNPSLSLCSDLFTKDRYNLKPSRLPQRQGQFQTCVGIGNVHVVSVSVINACTRIVLLACYQCAANICVISVLKVCKQCVCY